MQLTLIIVHSYMHVPHRYYPGFLQSAFLCKYQLDYIASGTLSLLDFLLGDHTLFYFMEVSNLWGLFSCVCYDHNSVFELCPNMNYN